MFHVFISVVIASRAHPEHTDEKAIVHRSDRVVSPAPYICHGNVSQCVQCKLLAMVTQIVSVLYVMIDIRKRVSPVCSVSCIPYAVQYSNTSTLSTQSD